MSNPILALLEEAPKNDTFAIPVGKSTDGAKRVVDFRSVHSFIDLQRLRQAAAAKAQETYAAFAGDDKVDDVTLSTLAKCFLMDSLVIDPTGTTTTQVFWRMATEYGGLFDAFQKVFDAKLAIGEQTLVATEIEQAKNDSGATLSESIS